MNKEVKLILISLGLYALSGGILYSFQELWLSSNNLSLNTIGIILSLASLLSVSVIFLSSNLIKQNKLKKFTTILFLLKSVIIFSLFLLNSSGFNIIIKFLVMCDRVIDISIFTSIYPLITIVTKNDKIFAIRGLINSFLYYIGVLLTSFFLGKKLFVLNFSYNFYLLIASLISFLGYLVLKRINLDNYYPKNDDDIQNNILYEVVRKIKTDKISHNYLFYIFFGDIGYYTITSLTITLLTKYLGFNPTSAGYIVLIVGITSAFLGLIILHKITFKNNYINFSIKFLSMFITFIITIIIATNGAYLFALIFIRITVDSYTHITDAPYINRFDSKYQLAFCNLREMVKCLSKSIGTFICGLVINYGVKYNFLIAAIFIGLQIIFGFNAIYLRNLELKKYNDR